MHNSKHSIFRKIGFLMCRPLGLFRKFKLLFLFAFCSSIFLFSSQSVLAQSSACTGDEDLVTFNFGAAAASNLTGSTGTWLGGSFANTYSVATSGSVGQNTVSFNIARTGVVIDAGEPALQTQGNTPNSLSYNVQSTNTFANVTLTVVFNRSVSKLRFNLFDMDRTTTWQDLVRISGFKDGSAVPIPVLVPTTPANYATTTVGVANEIKTLFVNNCAATDTICNVQVNFTNPVDRVELSYLPGPDVAAPAKQRIAVNNYSYCVPKRDLRLNKTSNTTTFVAGTTSTYRLTVNNIGGAATNGQTTVTDIISTQGVSFVSPQSPAGWTCGFSTTTFGLDTANCFTSTVIGAGGTAVLTLTVAISPSATASVAVNRGKVFGGGDPNKLLLTSTGPVASCNFNNENQAGGGATFFGGVDTTNAGCAFESTPLIRNAFLTASKANIESTLLAGSTTSYTITFANLGPSDAPGSVVKDPAVTGLNCGTPTFTSTPVNSIATLPVVLTVSAFQDTGVTLTPTFPANSTAVFVITCGVTATGLP